METIKHKSVYFDYIAIIAGSFLMAFSISSVFEPLNLVTGGVTGLGIIIKHLTTGLLPGMEQGIPIGISNIIINIPLFLLAIRTKGKSFLGRTLLATILLSVFLSVVPAVPNLPEDRLLIVIFGGVIGGLGIGFVFMGFATTGGTDLFAMILQDKFPGYSVSTLLGILDGVIVAVGAIVFGIEKAMYALIAIVIISKVSDSLIEGLKFSKMAYVISEQSDEIAEAIIQNMKRGITKIDVRGMYTKKQRDMLFCVVSRKEIVALKEVIRSIDEDAFVIISDVREAVGEGFLQYRE